MVTGKSSASRFRLGERVTWSYRQMVVLSRHCALEGSRRFLDRMCGGKYRIKAVKLSSLSTGKLNTLPCLHIRPINLVVFQGTLDQSVLRNLISGRASRLDAFSVYPFRS